MLFMIVEHFKNQDPVPVYRRFRERGRLAPEGVQYISSWVDEKMHTCFQLMETSHIDLIQQWVDQWADLVDFDIYPVISSQEAAQRMESRI